MSIAIIAAKTAIRTSFSPESTSFVSHHTPPRPTDRREREHSLPDPGPVAGIRPERGDLSQREYADEVEEQLERRGPFDFIRLASALHRSKIAPTEVRFTLRYAGAGSFGGAPSVATGAGLPMW